jgi:LssY C-terminus
MQRTSVFSRSLSTTSWAALLLLLVAHGPLAAQDYKFTVPTAQPWTDTGVDLPAGALVAISASANHSSAGASCDPAGVTSASTAPNLPVATALPGALIARVQENGTPSLVGASQQLRVPQAGHLYLGINTEGAPPCQGSFAVKVHITPAGGAEATAATAAPESLADKGAQTPGTKPATGTPPATSDAQAKTAGGEKDVKDIKGALATAAQTWLTGQFGTGTAASAPGAPTPSATPGGTSAPASAAVATAQTLKLSNAPLDSQLRGKIDSLPRRVNDQFQNQGDMVNFVIVGNLQKVQEALTAADWHPADRDVKESVLKAALETYEKKAYLAMPMSELYLFGRVQDYGYEQAEPYAVVASRHHFRIWKAPFQWNGQDLWVGAGTHDIGFEKDQRNGKVTHKIDPAVDGERDNIGATLQKTDKVKSLTYYLPPNPVQDARNATGGGYHSDGRILVVVLQ